MIKVATINICFDMEYWHKRRDLLVTGLKETNADIIGVQEIDENKANFLVEKLSMPYIYRVGDVAILSRHPFIQQEAIDL
jgi:mRNA deadenylase 3'-5' endonuclease subunit Ccr4